MNQLLDTQVLAVTLGNRYYFHLCGTKEETEAESNLCSATLSLLITPLYSPLLLDHRGIIVSTSQTIWGVINEKIDSKDTSWYLHLQEMLPKCLLLLLKLQRRGIYSERWHQEISAGWMESQRRCHWRGFNGVAVLQGKEGKGTPWKHRGTKSVPVSHPGSHQHHALLSVVTPHLYSSLQVFCLSCPRFLASAAFLIRGPQPLQQGVGAPGPGMAPDKQLELLVTESVIYKGKAETNHWSQGGKTDKSLHWGKGVSALSSSLCIWEPLTSFKTSLSIKPPVTTIPPPSPCKSALHTAQNPFLPFIMFGGNCSSIGPRKHWKAAFHLTSPAQSLGSIYGNNAMTE